MCDDINNQLYVLLEGIQLERFYQALREKLQISRIVHFNHVKPKDLEQVGMSKPAIRRLLEAVEKSKASQARPRPPPPPPFSTIHLTQQSSFNSSSTINSTNRNSTSNSDQFFSKVNNFLPHIRLVKLN
jgi:hypothetical protein